MKLLNTIWNEFIGLFVDDGNLALHVLILVFGIAALVKLAILAPLAGAAILLVGCLFILAVSLDRKSRTGRRREGPDR